MKATKKRENPSANCKARYCHQSKSLPSAYFAIIGRYYFGFWGGDGKGILGLFFPFSFSFPIICHEPLVSFFFFGCPVALSPCCPFALLSSCPLALDNIWGLACTWLALILPPNRSPNRSPSFLAKRREQESRAQSPESSEKACSIHNIKCTCFLWRGGGSYENS